MKSRSVFRTSGSLAVLALLLAMNSPFTAAQIADSEEISNLLLNAKSHAILADNDAATLESYTNSKLPRQTHAAKLQDMTEHVNGLVRVSKQLNNVREKGSPWQQTAIDQIDPLLR